MSKFSKDFVSPITLEDLKLTASEAPLTLIYSGDLIYRGYGRDMAVCNLTVYSGPNRKVFIATETSKNKGLNITNGIERVAVSIEAQFSLGHVFGPTSDRTHILVEHYTPESYAGRGGCEDFSVMEFKHEKGSCVYYGDPGWWGVEKKQIERLIGGQLG